MMSRKMLMAHRRLPDEGGVTSPTGNSGKMCGKKREMEIVFNLLWNQRPLNADDRSNVVGMYDVPSTTLTWERFKAYLLKNSGSPCADIEVTYVDSDNKDVPIDSQEKFLLAMYAFRKRARIGDIITLKLDKVAVPQKKKVKADAEPDLAEEPPFLMDDEAPPPWFIKYMKKFKRDLVEEMTSLVVKNVSKLSTPKESSTSVSRKIKADYSHKKPRKLPLAPAQTISAGSVDLKKYMKFESKLEKLEQKSLKIKAKKLALKVKEVPHAKRLIGLAPTDVELYMNATPVDNHMPTVPRMLGGEVFLQQWRVTNSGDLPWSDQTELKLAWGSKELIPIDRTVKCPHLMPGEEGQVSVLLDIPVTPGRYECYWHLHHNGVRFGHWLGCFVIVDSPPIHNHLLPNKQENSFENKSEPVSNENNIEELFADKLNLESATKQAGDVDVNIESSDFDKKFDSGEGSSRSSSVSNASYVFVNKGEDEEDEEEKIMNGEEDRDVSSEEDMEKVENEEEDEEKKESDENNEESLGVDENMASEYAYIVYKGEKFPLHKKFLTDECFQRAEKVQNIPLQEETVSTSVTNSTEQPNKERLRSAKIEKQRTSSESSGTRLFVFPQHSPGFEVVYPEEKREENAVDLSFDSNFTQCNSSTNGQNNQNDSMASSVLLPQEDKCICNHNRPPLEQRAQQCFETPFPFKTGPCDCNYCADEDYSSWEQPEYTHHALCCKHQDYHRNRQIHRSMEHFRQAQENLEQRNEEVAENNRPFPAEQNQFEQRNEIPIDRSSFYERSTQSCHGSSGSFCSNSLPKGSVGGETPLISESVCSGRSHSHRRFSQQHRKPENLITGAAILASSALSTARSMMNMVIQNGGGKWVNGHWVVDNPNTKRENGLRILADMGFMNRDLNATLLARYNDDVHRVISELIL